MTLTKAKKYKTGMVFGVFDLFHDGHKHFLSEASDHCEKLIAVVTLPEIVKELKKRIPENTYEERVENIKSFDENIIVIPSDTTLGAWKIFEEHNPEIILLGYDQEGIKQEILKLGKSFEFISPHEPEKYKSSLLRKT